MMKKIISYFICFLLLNCTTPVRPDKVLSWQEQYELVTRIKLPKGFKIIANPPVHSNELVRKTVIGLNKKDCKAFYKYYGFEPVVDTLSPLVFGSSFMDSVYQSIPDRKSFLHKYGKNYSKSSYFKYNDKEGNTNWVYLLDTTTCRLYCLISYPNWNGYAK